MNRQAFRFFVALGLLAAACAEAADLGPPAAPPDPLGERAPSEAPAGDAATSSDGCAGDCQACCPALGVPWCDDVCGYSGFIGEAEVTFFRYHRADGVRVGDSVFYSGDLSARNENVEFGFEAAPRITLGWVGPAGFGARARWWDYHHSAPAFDDPSAHLTVNTHVLDAELFDAIRLNNNWTAEVSGGIRHNEFSEHMVDPIMDRINAFSGFGGVVGLELERCLGSASALFARARAAILMDDRFIHNESQKFIVPTFEPIEFIEQDHDLLDSTQGMIELAIGYEACREVGCGAHVFARATAEWQTWYNYSSAFDGSRFPERFFDGSSDVGFGGFAFSVGIGR